MKIYILTLLMGLGWWLMPLTGAGQSIQLSIPDSTITEGESVVMPVHVDSSLTGHAVLSYRIELQFNEYLLRLDSVSTKSTLSSTWETSVNKQPPGNITVASAGSDTLQGTGVLFYLHFSSKRDGSTGVNFTSTADNYFNEGSPSMLLVNGYIRINALPELSFSPSSALLTSGDQQQFSVSGGTSPYQWTVTDTAVASIDQNGLLTAEGHGFTRVVATDVNGVSDTTTGQVEVRAFELMTVDTSEYQGLDLVLPIHVSDLSGLEVTSGEFTMRFDERPFEITELITTGTLLENGQTDYQNNSRGAQIAFATSQSLTAGGILLYARVSLSADYSGRYAFYFEDIVFNENLTGNSETRYITIDQLPDLTMNPTSAELLRGDSLQFSVSNNTGPVQWSVSHSGRATMKQDGWLIAEQGGTVTVTATDSIGSTVTSNPISIYDVQVSFPQSSALVGDTVSVPVNISNLPAIQDIISIQGTLSFNSNVVSMLGVTAVGSQTDGWAFSTEGATTGQMNLAGAGSERVQSDGVLFYVDIVVDSSLTTATSSYLNFNELLINEGQPLPKTVNGSLDVQVSLSAPVLSSPADGATEISPDTSLSWQSVTGADTYDLQIDDVNTFASPAVDTTGIAGVQVQAYGLSTSTTYYWRVRAVSVSGVAGAWSAIRSFTTRDFINVAPIVTKVLPDFTLDEDFAAITVASLDTVFSDQNIADGDSLTFSVIASSGIVSPGLQNNVFTISAEPDSSGVTEIVVSATDTYGLAISDTLSVTVNPVNDLPELSLPSDTLKFSNDSSASFTVWDYASDVETPAAQLSYSFNSSNTAIATSYTQANGNLEITASGFVGNGQIYVTAKDPQNASVTDTLHISVTQATSISRNPAVPVNFELRPNYPNPFNPSTMISYDLPEATRVRLTVYNLSGQVVASLVNGTQPAGTYNIRFDAGDLSSGMYFYRLYTGKFEKIRKMTLVK